MKIEYKNVSVGGVTKVKDEGKGVVTAYVSVTGIEDNVKDVILPDAYKKTLGVRTPKGAWGHDWKTPTAKTLAADELPPGHPDLPKTLPDGKTPWPEAAGALRIKMKFNLGSTRGRDAYSDVMFFKDEQEWSIGYSVPKGGSYTKDGVRYIKELDLYEYSPVLFGAMPHARTASVKDAQLAFKQLNGATADEIKEWEGQLTEYKSLIDAEFKDVEGEGTDPTDSTSEDADVEEADGDSEGDDFYEDGEEDDDDEDDDDEEKSLFGMSADEVRNVITVCEKILIGMGESLKEDDTDLMEQAAVGQQAYIEAKATEATSASYAADMVDGLTESDYDALQTAAERFDDAVASDDTVLVEKAATDLLDVVEAAFKKTDEGVDGLHVVATVVADTLTDLDLDADGQYTGKSYTVRGEEYKHFEYDTTQRMFGTVHYAKQGRIATGGSAMRAFVKMLDDEPLFAMADYIEAIGEEGHLKRLVSSEVQRREEKIGDSDYGAGMRHPVEEGVRKKKPVRKRGRQTDQYEDEDERRRGTGRIGPRKPGMKRDYSSSQRDTAATRGNAMEDGSFPINNVQDLKNAIKAFGRAKDKEKAKAHIIKRANELGKEDLIPEDWKSAEEKTVVIDVSEFKELGFDI